MTDSSSERSNWQLQVNRSELALALRTLGRTGHAVANAQAIFTFDGSALNLDLAGGVAQIPAVGTWPKEVRLPGDALERLAKVLPDENPLPFESLAVGSSRPGFRSHAKSGTLHIQRLSGNCFRLTLIFSISFWCDHVVRTRR
jgi:hypothetical protein